MEYNEQKLIEKAAAGDAYAFEQLMEKHESRMYAVALRICRNREDAQDCLQDAMLRIYKALPNFKGLSSFSTWVYRIAMNTCLDELRRKKVRQAQSLDTLMESGYSPQDPGETPESHAEASAMRKEIEKAIGDLPQDMRAAIVLRDIHGYSYEEISDILDTNVGTIKSRISRGREKLREVFVKQKELFGRDDV